MSSAKKPEKRRYNAAQRQEAAAQRRLAVIAAARDAFERHGWSGALVRDIAAAAGVSQKLVEAQFGTKATLLQAAVDFAIRGDIEATPMPQRQAIAEMEAAPDARAMLDLHARHLRTINERSAEIALAVEQAAESDPAVTELWQQMNENRAYAVRWAATTLLRKRGRRHRLSRRDAEATFWIALDWRTYRTLTQHAQLTADEYEAWLRSYYRDTLLAR